MAPVVPIYYQIKNTIKKWILNGEFNPGDKIPSENELAGIFKVSRLTVRQAISQLIQEGFLASRRGEGTFVTRNESLINSFSLQFTGFMDDLFYQISKSKTQSVQMTKVTAPKSIKEKLDLEEDAAFQIKRVRFLEGRSFAYTINYLPLEIGERINEKLLLKKPLLQIMEEDLGIDLVEAFQTIQASFAEQDVAEKLGIPSGSPILFVERVMYTKGHRPVELVQTSYRGDLYKYIVHLRKIRNREGSIWIHGSQ